MTETEKMLAILRERGIEYREVNSMVTDIEHDGIKTRVYDYDDGPDYQLCVEQKWLTAEEAVRVALGTNQQEVLERRIDELCAEVEALKRDEWAAGFNAACDAIKAADEDGRTYYEVENAKLRKLLLDVWNDAIEFDGFWDYVHDDGEIYDKCVLPHYQERMRELGVEVDG